MVRIRVRARTRVRVGVRSGALGLESIQGLLLQRCRGCMTVTKT